MQDFKKKHRQNLTSPTKNVSMKRHASEPNLSPAKRPCLNSPELASQLPTRQQSIEYNSDDLDDSVLNQALDDSLSRPVVENSEMNYLYKIY